jgi:hypothetical protein
MSELSIIARIVIEDDYWDRGHFHQGTRKVLKRVGSIEHLPIGTELIVIPSEVQLNYAPLFDFAAKHNISYNELCAVVRESAAHQFALNAAASKK